MRKKEDDTLSLSSQDQDKLAKKRLDMLHSFGGVLAGSLVSMETMPLLEKGNYKYIPLAGVVTMLASTLLMTKAIRDIHKIEKDKKPKKTGVKILAGALVLTTGISYGVHKHHEVNHREEICPVTKILMGTPFEKYGLDHQIYYMEEEFRKDNKAVKIDYEDNNFKPFVEKSPGFYICDEYLPVMKKSR